MAIFSISQKSRKLKGRITLPASKSISNRLLIIRALCTTDIFLENLSTADDTVLLHELLNRIKTAACSIHGQTPPHDHGLPTGTEAFPCSIDCRNAGTVMRFLTAYLAIQPGTWLLSGSDRMHHRPVGILVDALRSLGALIEYDGIPGYPPLRITGKKLKGGEVTVDGSVSSQFISSLLLIAPALPEGLTIQMIGPQVSFPYVEMTIRIMEQLGAEVEREKGILRILPGKYHSGLLPANRYLVEADWSSAAFWYEAAALAGEAEIRLPGLHQHSLQGDSFLAELFRPLGVETTFNPDGSILSTCPPVRLSDCPPVRLSACPDLAPALIVTYAVLGIPARFTGLQHLAVKESDRLKVMELELQRIGRPIRIPSSDSAETLPAGPMLPIIPGETPVCIETYGDHRIAMAFAPLALKTGAISISDHSVVAKSYPGFWEDLRKLGFVISEAQK